MSGNANHSIEIVVDVATAIYPVAAIHRALYWLADRTAGEISEIDVGRVRIRLQAHDGVDAVALREALMQSLTDFSVRVDIEDRTKNVRDAIARAALRAVDPAAGHSK